MHKRLSVPFLAFVLLVSGCSSDGYGHPSTHSTATPNFPKCLHQVQGEGDLEVTDRVVTVLNPDAGDDYKVSWAVEVANRSKADRAMAAGVELEFLDGEGERIPSPDGEGDALDFGRVEYVAPGKSAYLGGTFVEGFKKVPEEIKVKLDGNILHPDMTYWWPHDDVEYPTELEVGDITTQETEKGTRLDFEVSNDGNVSFDKVDSTVVLRDSQGDLLGGQFAGYVSVHDFEPLEVPRGENKLNLQEAFPDGLPADTDLFESEIRLANSPTWTDVDPECRFSFEPPPR